MRKLLLFAFAALALISCKKTNSTGPDSLPVATEYDALNIKAGAQVVKMKVAGNQLTMVYNEDVTLILDSGTLAKFREVHLKEDLGATKLNDYDYRSMTKGGVNATNWVDDNLNNIVIQSSKDTLVNNRIYVKKHIVRTFTYQKAYGTNDAALSVMNGLLKQTDILTFSAYYAPENPDVATTTNTAKLTYVKM